LTIADRTAYESRSMCEQILDRDLPFGGDSIETRRSTTLAGGSGRWLIALQDTDLQVFELVNKLRNGIGSPHYSVVHEHQDCATDDGLCHRHDAEHRVSRHRLSGLNVHETLRLEMSDTAVSGNERHGTGDVARIDLPLHQITDSLQAL